MRDVVDEEDEVDEEDVEDLVEDQIDDRIDPLLPEPKDRDKLPQAVLPELTTLISTRSLLFNRFRTEDVCTFLRSFGIWIFARSYSHRFLRRDSLSSSSIVPVSLLLSTCILLLWTSFDTQFNEL